MPHLPLHLVSGQPDNRCTLEILPECEPTMSILKRWKKPLLAALVPVTLSAGAWAQTDFPSKPLRLVVPYAAGGSSDVMARAISDELGKKLGQSVIVENRAGAGSLLGTQYVAAEPADGYTLLIADVPFTIVPSLYKERAKYDPLRSFAPVALLGVAPMYLFVNQASPAKSAQDLVAQAKAQPSALSIGSGGNGSLTHLMAELLMINAGIQLTHVPYKGASASVTDLAASQLNASFTTMASAVPLLQAQKIRPLGVSSAQRSKEAPDVPTFAEQGIQGMGVESWWGVMVPAGTPAPVVDKLSSAMQDVLAQPSVKTRMQAVGVSAPASSSPKALSDMVQADLQRWGVVIERAGIKLD